MKIVAAILSYKMRELTDRTVRQLIYNGFIHGEDLFVFENQEGPYVPGSTDPLKRDVSQYITHFTGSNLRMTGGFNYICDTVAKWPNDEQPDVLWLCTNDFEILEIAGDKSLKETIASGLQWPGPRGSEAISGWWHPSLETIPNYAYPWMFQQHGYWVRQTWMTDFICPALRWKDLREIHSAYGHWFNPRFYRGWGIDYETCYRLRLRRRGVLVDDRVKIRHEASKTYTSGAATESKDEFYTRALDEMHSVMVGNYGRDWHQIMQEARR